MAANGEHVDAFFQRTNGQIAEGLDGVDVEGNAFFFGDGTDGSDGLDHARFIIGVHGRNEDRIVTNGGGHIVCRGAAVGIDGDIGDVIALFLQSLEGAQDGMVFDGRRDDVAALGEIGPQIA